MPHTAMAAMRVHLHGPSGAVPGVDVNVFLAPIVLFVLLVVVALAYVYVAMPSGHERAEAASFRKSMSEEEMRTIRLTLPVTRSRYRPLR